jgi:predicted Rossmann fold nucleotide-binding protein DprA/Smf involved in DNA uptake
MRIPQEYRIPLEQGRLLLLSPFSGKQRRATVEAALFRNRLVAALADRVFVPYAAPSSKTFELCRAIESWRKLIYTLAGDANASLLGVGAKPLPSGDAFSLE